MRQIFYGYIWLLCLSCNRAVFKSKWTKEKAPSTYVARFETSKGLFDVRVNREWSPAAADRFYQLVRHRFFDDALFYRVVPNFVAQFGTSDSLKMNKWMQHKIPDEQTVQTNRKGTISFARSGKESRGTDLFINLADNPRLDTIFYNEVKGFPPFGDVVNGMEVVSALYSGYGDRTMPYIDSMYKDRRRFLAKFSAVDTIRKAYIFKN
jgi:homoserine O-acetyltransferase